jgi:branched-chain amino acid transport system permease protein
MEYLGHLALTAGIFMILALGLHIINGAAGLFSLGHAGLWAVGAYASAVYSVYFPLEFLPDFLNLQVACLVGMGAAALAGLIVGIPCLRLRGDYLAIATLGFSEIIRIAIINMDFVGGPRGFTNIPRWSNIFWVYTWVVIVLIVLVNLLRGGFGRAIISIREDEIAAESMGINVFAYKTYAFTLGSAAAGLGGALFAHSQQFLHPNGFTFMWSVVFLLMIILGGLGSTTGAIVGATILTILPELLRFFGDKVAEWRMVIYSLLLIFLMLLRPKGLLGKEELTWTKIKNAANSLIRRTAS